MREEVLGKNPRILSSGKHDSIFYRDLWDTLLSRGVWKGRITDKTKDGALIELDTTISAVRDHLGEIASLVAVSRDVTEMVKLENQLRQSQKLEAIGSLAAGIAHEINTPIQFVGDNTRFLATAFADLMLVLKTAMVVVKEAELGMVDSRLYREYLSVVEHADLGFLETEVPGAIEQTLQGVERVATIVRAMKDFSHPGGSEKSLADVNKVLRTALVVAGHEIKNVADVEIDFDPNLPLVPCYPGPLNQVLLNLLVNAAHAIADVVADGSQKRGTIGIGTSCHGNEVVIGISDTGKGIKREIRDRVFDPFFTTKGVGKGTGQGLAIARSVIVEKHGGSIRFESEEGKGTIFYVTLPLTSSVPTGLVSAIP
jgi:signal transduction histidine kinase